VTPATSDADPPGERSRLDEGAESVAPEPGSPQQRRVEPAIPAPPAAEPAFPSQAGEGAGIGDDAASVGTRALRGVPWTIVSFALSRGTQLIGTLVIARLVPPAQIGVVLTGLVVINTFNLLADNGLSISLVVRDDRDDRLTGTVLSLMVGFALCGVVVVDALAHPISGLFGAPRLADVLPLLSLTIVTSTITWLLTNLLQREMMWRERFMGQFTLSIVYVIVAVPCAALGAGLWSMVAGQLASGVLASAVLWRVYPHPLRPHFDRRLARRALSESRSFISQSSTSFMIENLHFVAVSAVLGSEPMALYSMSCRLTELPNRAIAAPVSEAAFPAYVRLRDDHERRSMALITSLRYVSLATLCPLAILAATAPDFIAVVLGPRWHSAREILAILCIWGALTGCTGTLAWFVNANTGARFLASINLVRLFVMAPAIFLAAALSKSTVLVSVLVSLDALIVLVPLVGYSNLRLAISVTGIARGIALPMAAAGAAVAGGLLLRSQMHAGGITSLERLLAVGALAGAVYGVVVAIVDRATIGEMRSLLARALGRA
jgi:O-antigen/teichoic acid export membrane protein